MKRYSNTLFLATVILVVACFSVPIRLSAQYSEKNADAVFEDVTHEYVLHEDGSTSYAYEHHLRILTSFAYNRAYGESFIVYNPKWQTLTVTSAETKMADGTLVKAPFNAFNEVLPGFAANAAPYLGLKEMVVGE